MMGAAAGAVDDATFPLQQIRRRKLYEEVAEQLEQSIQDGEYAPAGQLPSERDLMRHFGVGRPAVREALFHLRKMGLVEVRSGERARVTRPTHRSTAHPPKNQCSRPAASRDAATLASPAASGVRARAETRGPQRQFPGGMFWFR